MCWDDFALDESVRQLNCDHMYHEACIVPWLELHGTCPVCRKSQQSEEEEQRQQQRQLAEAASGGAESASGQQQDSASAAAAIGNTVSSVFSNLFGYGILLVLVGSN